MTMNNEPFEVIKNDAENIEEKEGLEIIEEDEFEDYPLNEEIAEFYENNKEAIDFIGGYDILDSILDIEEEEFKTLEPHFLSIFLSLINEANIEAEFRHLIITQHYTVELFQDEFAQVFEGIDEITTLSNSKKDFLKEICTLLLNKVTQIINDVDQTIHIPCELAENVQLPVYAHETDAGLDIYAREEITIAPGETKIIGTGIKTAIPEGYAILIQPRSGQSVKTKLRIANTPGLIDSGYRDEIGVIVENIEPPFKDIDYEFDDNGEIHIKSILHGNSYTIAEGQRFAQMRLVQVPKADFVQVESVGDIGEDRGGGFGSSGQ